MDSEFSWSTDYRHPADWDQSFAPLSLPDMLAASVAGGGDAPMLTLHGSPFQLCPGGARCGAGRTRAIARPRKGSRVGLFLPNVPHYVAAYYGALAVGATVVNFSPLYTARELEDQVEDSAPTRCSRSAPPRCCRPRCKSSTVEPQAPCRRLGRGRTRLSQVRAALSLVQARRHRPHSVRSARHPLFGADRQRRAPRSGGDRPRTRCRAIQYTGGTTGTPKGPLTHQNLTANARQVNAIDPDHDADDRILGVLPFFHVFANTRVLNRTILNGGTITMLPRFGRQTGTAAITRTRTTALPAC